MIERDAERGIFNQCGANDFRKRRGKIGQRELAGRFARGEIFAERFAERDAERPDVSCGEQNRFRRGKWSGQRPRGRRFARRQNAVGGEFYVVAGGVNVGRLEPGVNESIFMQKIEHGKNCGEHAASFVWRERAARKKLAEVFVGELGNEVEAR